MNSISFDIKPVFPKSISAVFIDIASSCDVINKLSGTKKLNAAILKKTDVELGNIYFASEALLKFLQEDLTEKTDLINLSQDDKNDLTSLYNLSENALHSFRTVHSHFEKVDFFNNAPLKELCENTLNNFYKIESPVRVLSFAGNSPVPEDKSLIEMAARLSINSLS